MNRVLVIAAVLGGLFSMVYALGSTFEGSSSLLDRKLLTAVECGDRSAVERLLGEGANINARNAAQFTALHLAVRDDNQDLARLLIDRGADLTVTGPSQLTPAAYAAYLKLDDMSALFDRRQAR